MSKKICDKTNQMDDWERIENGIIDAIVFEHPDYYNVFHVTDGFRVQTVIDKPEMHLKKALKEFNLKNVERKVILQ